MFSHSPSILQWGHVFSDVEIELLANATGYTPDASMGPRLFRRGNDNELTRMVLIRFASMGPRLFRRGNFPNEEPNYPVLWGFNGATSFQTWK